MERTIPRVLQAIGLGLTMGVGTALAVGIPTAVIPNQWFRRMTPTRPQDYVFLAATALLAAAIGATYAHARDASCPRQEGKLTAGGMLSFLAIGCPICNKLVVALLGVSGALNYFAPVQPFLGLASVALLGVTLTLRFRAIQLTANRLASV
ncbi:MAG: hypothetical protein ACYDAR_01710 [Thermomicrobiales bacterium]